MSEREARSRYEVYLKNYDETVTIEARCAVNIAVTQIVPAAVEYQKKLLRSLEASEAVGVKNSAIKKLLAKVCRKTDELLIIAEELSAVEESKSKNEVLSTMLELRQVVDDLEGVIPSDLWPLPTYAEMMFVY